GAPADAPEELKKPLTPARQILENTQHVGMQMIDYENRAAGFYNEGLAFHHSYKPTIDRQIRRVHIFGQQTEDYPAFKGFTYTWFPALGGYTEGGVCVDPYFGKRMEALQSIVKDKTGATPVPWPEWQKAFKPETSPEVRRQMTDQHRKYWKAEQHYGYYQTLNQWREKLREVDARLISTTSTNAGHDPGTLVSEMANGLDAMSFEHYTDYGDWPASMGWIVAWAKSRIGDKQLWYTIDGANQNPMLAAKAIASMAHGCEGVGLPMLAPSEKRDYAKKKIINDFLAKYGTLAFAYQPDNTVQIMGNVMDGGNYWDEHALYGALMRLGYSPNVLFEETVEAGKIPQGTRVIFLPKVKLPFSAECEASLKKFIAAGGVVATVGPNCYPFDGAKHYEFPLKGLWEVGGFWSHKDFWDEFERERPDIEKMMAELQLAPKWGSEPDKAPIYSMPAGGLQYLAVCSSVAGTIDMAFTPASGLKVKVNGAKKVINLVTQQELPVQDDAVTVDLIAEPAAFLVLLDTAPEGVKLHFPAEVKAGGTFELSADVLGDAKISAAQVPVQYTITDPAGKVRATFDRLSGKDKVQYLTAETDDVGEWTVSAQELLTGVQAQAKLKVTASSSTLNAIAQAPDVFIPHPDRLPLFLKGQGDVRVIIEETQADLEPDAQRIVDALKSAGRTAIVEKVQATSFDTVWLKWFPGPKEEKVLGQIDKGELIGYRGQLSPYVSKATSKFLPEKGGWTDVAPMYLVRNDVVLFSGGRLCVSLAAMNDWQATANFPGKAQGIVDVALSPFWADKHAISVVSNDEAGRKKAVEKLIEVIGKKGEAQQAAAFPASGVAPASNEVIGKERIALEAPMKGMVPPALVKTMTASADGHVAVELKDKTVLLSPSGEVQRITAPSLIEPSMAADGTFYGGKTVTTQLNAAWHFTTAWKVSVEVTPPSGDLKRFWLPEEFDPGDMVDGWQSAYKVSPDGKTFFAPHMGGGYTLIDLQSNISKSFNDATDKVMFYERLRDRPFVNAVQFSGDGQFVVYAASNKPTGYGGMMGPPPFPYCESLRMVNAKTGEVVWRRDVARQDGMELSAMDNAITVADQGKKVAYIDWAQNARMLDETGREIWARQLFDYKPIAGNNANANPKPLRAEFSKDATSAIFASNGHIIIADGDGGNAVALEVPALVDIHIAPDGSCFYTADADGVIGCFKRDGKQVWTKQTTGDRPRLIATDKGVLVGAGNGNLLTFDTSGNVVKTLPLADLKLDKLEFTEVKLQGPGTYREPETLSTLKKVAGARQAKAWQGEGEAKEAFGRKFYAVGAAVQLSAAGPEQHVVHLVYRHKFGGAAVKQDLNSEYGLKATIAETKTEEPKVKQPAGPAPSVTVDNGDKKLTFILDLATPEYRVVDLPCDAKTGCSVTVNPAADLEIAELSIWSFNFPGSNGLYIQPAKAGMQQTDGLDDKKSKDPDDPDTIVLDPTDNASVAKAHAGKMKNAAIFALNGDPDQVQGHYVRQTGNVMDTFDGQKFLDGKPSAWTPAKEGGFGSRMMIDMGYIAKPKLCVTYDRSLKQSEVMSAVAALKAKKTDFQGNNPDLLAFEPRVVRGVTTNDQFFNVFDVSGVDMEALCVYVAGAGTDLGLSEIELYE
ncbi:MAG TPA: PQQ-binding-like beta-propeller repeat protein, partial [Tepidisphaeraceae bacterium]